MGESGLVVDVRPQIDGQVEGHRDQRRRSACLTS